MFLERISLVNFKNYGQAEYRFTEKINCFLGDNGVGKTNMLDAIFYLSMCKSYLNPVDSQLVNHGQDFFILQGDYQKENVFEFVYCGYQKSKKKVFKRNKKEYERLADHIGLLPVVMVSPADSALVLEGSEIRRKFLNGVISQYDAVYLDNLMRYNRVLAQRNKLLKDWAVSRLVDRSLMEALDYQLVAAGEKVFKARASFLERLSPMFQEYYNYISCGTEEVKLIYQSQLESGDFAGLLKAAFEKDCGLQYSSVGVHKDDLAFELKGHPIKKLGSQGQQKTYLLALRLAQFDFIAAACGVKPLLLLDDVFDKLDLKRITQLLDLVGKATFGQIFITDTNAERLDQVLEKIDARSEIFTIAQQA